MDQRIRKNILVQGSVQGVWFRDSMRQEAAQAGVSGWVTNRADGALEAELEGEPDAVDGVVEWARRGPPRASVSQVEVAERPPEGGDGFEVR